MFNGGCRPTESAPLRLGSYHQKFPRELTLTPPLPLPLQETAAASGLGLSLNDFSDSIQTWNGAAAETVSSPDADAGPFSA